MGVSTLPLKELHFIIPQFDHVVLISILVTKLTSRSFNESEEVGVSKL
jgi:hypothetical protein